ncbi:4-aminobutyrate--2-oxoglutarate transaminase [Bifidobacterium primatium]|uniref:(S)-3-amino-2-methylpropionate transaminase n=1 Tax=Bifidobacterium primatium TaxID=2045438 RepID=A0A2M9H9N2_9BIFI|nr:4-aminobutyrate--2-oxoglutarate transaminase [Bifidobacterium primatium]PJM73497.1 4-aminobutyrate--2-oxoglutarate transaminase [Bifidobacterium primatium]
MSVPQVARKIATAIPGPKSQALEEEHKQYVSAGVGQLMPVFAESASGATITDVDGNRFIDLASGIAVTGVGNCAPEVVKAVQDEVAKLTHTNFATTPYANYIEVCKKLAEHTPGDFAKKSVLVNSGAEAVENAIKIARKYTGRSAVVVMENAFHGRTNLTMAMTTKSMPYKQGFGAFAPDIYRVPFSYPLRDGFGSDGAAAAKAAAAKIELLVGHENVAAIIAEPVQGEGGFIVPAPGFLSGLADWAHEHDVLYISDEIQAGFCRTGKWFACEYDGVTPDLITTAKALGGGMPIAAVTGRAEIMDSVQAGGIGGTYGGNPVSCASALAAVKLMEDKGLPARAAHIGELADAALKPLVDELDTVAEVRGLGAMIGIEFVKPGSLEPNKELVGRIAKRTVQEGLIVLTCGINGNVIRLLPTLTITDEEFGEALDVLKEIITEESAK